MCASRHSASAMPGSPRRKRQSTARTRASPRCSRSHAALTSGPSIGAAYAPPMRAMVLERAGQPLRLADVAEPEPGPGEIALEVQACGVCRTDLHIVDGELS